MKISSFLTDKAILTEIGERLAAVRIERNLTQARVAEKAGIAKRTLERLESGQVSIQLTSLLRVCRVLGLLEQLDAFLPEQQPGPMALLQRHGRKRRRASGSRASGSRLTEENAPWTWGEGA